MRLVIVRHGETIDNKRDICQGQKGGTLTRKGILQTRKLARRLKKEQFDIIYCSDLKRTKDTLKEIKKYHPKTKIMYSKELRERSHGIFEGMKHSEIKKYYQEHNLCFETHKPKGGESFAEKDRRALKFYNKMVKKHHDENVLWVTHGGVIFTVLKKVMKLKKEQFDSIIAQHTAVSVIEVDENENHTAKLVNCVKHL